MNEWDQSREIESKQEWMRANKSEWEQNESKQDWMRANKSKWDLQYMNESERYLQIRVHNIVICTSSRVNEKWLRMTINDQYHSF
jgi:hypothetical protein